MEAVASEKVAAQAGEGKAKSAGSGKGPSVVVAKAQASEILAALQSVGGAIERRTSLAIASNVLMAKRGTTLELTGTDLEVQMRSHAEIGHGTAEVATTANARKLVEILRAMPAEQMTTLTLTGDKLVVTGGKSRFTVQTLPAADFPLVVPAKEVNATIKLAQKTLASLISQVQYAMANGDVRHYLNGMLMETEGNAVRVVATDGHRLATTQAIVEAEMATSSVILPRKTVIELARLLKDDDSEAEITLAANQATFRFAGVELTTKLIEGKFPDYKRVIPSQNKTKVTFERTMLLASLERASLLTSEKFKGVRLTFEGDTLAIESSNAEQEEAREEIGIDYDAKELTIGFNVAYLIAAVQNMTSDTVTLALKDGQASALLTEPDAPEMRAVVMPMRV